MQRWKCLSSFRIRRLNELKYGEDYSQSYADVNPLDLILRLAIF